MEHGFFTLPVIGFASTNLNFKSVFVRFVRVVRIPSPRFINFHLSSGGMIADNHSNKIKYVISYSSFILPLQVFIKSILRPYRFFFRIPFQHIIQIFIHPTGFSVIFQLNSQHIYQLLFQIFVKNGGNGLYTPVQVAPHPIRRTHEQKRFPPWWKYHTRACSKSCPQCE